MNAYDNVIVTDFDGCCGYWEHGFHMWMIANGYKEVERGHYDIERKYGISTERADLLMQAFNESSAMRYLPPVRDAIKYIRKLHEDHGYVFHCISAVPNLPSIFEARKENIQNLFGKTAFERLTLCGSSKNKRDILREYDGTECVWIEDVSENVEYGLEYGMRCILMDHHYNLNDEVDRRVKRVYSWKEIYSLIEGDRAREWYK
jgi:5'(3')-deoxyribonucleotidase